MKKFIKVCVILGILFVISGLGLTAGAAVAGVDLNWIYRGAGRLERYLERGVGSLEDYYGGGIGEMAGGRELTATYSDVRKLDLTGEAAEIYVERGGDGELITVEITADSSDYDLFMDGRTLKLKLRKSRDGRKAEVTVLVPENYILDELELELSASSARLDHIQAEKLEAELRAASLEVVEGDIARLELDNKAGSFTFQGNLGSHGELENSAGNIEMYLFGEAADYNYELDLSMGDVKIGESSYSGMKVIKTIDNGADRLVKIESRVGEVQIDFYE